jgi:hypothetical protein
MPDRFRKKPIEVEAVQWTGENRGEVEEFAVAGGVRLRDGLAHRSSDALPSDWIVRVAASGECFVVRADSFDATYEPAPKEPETSASLTCGDGELLAELEKRAEKWQRDRAKCKQAEADDQKSGKLGVSTRLETYQATWNYYEGLAKAYEEAARLVRESASQPVLALLRDAVDAAGTLATYTYGRSEIRAVAEAKETIDRCRAALSDLKGSTASEGGEGRS